MHAPGIYKRAGRACYLVRVRVQLYAFYEQIKALTLRIGSKFTVWPETELQEGRAGIKAKAWSEQQLDK